MYGFTQEEVARRVGRSRPAIANALRLLALPEAVKAQLEGGELSAGHARAVLSVEGSEARVEFAREIASQKLPKSEAERRGAGGAVERTRRRGAARRDRPTGVRWRMSCHESWGTRVRLQPRARGGVIEIGFYSNAELERLLTHLRGRVAEERAF